MNIRTILSWLDENIVFILSAFLLAFIPLYPKLPLFDVLPGYIVRVRLEDFFVAVTILVWLIQLLRGKLVFGPNPLAKPILLYLGIGVASMVSAVFISQTVPLQFLHVGKMGLHFARRVEYFSLFFIFYSSIKNLKQVKIYLAILVITMSAVTIYGYGQKYLFWPAFSTMNREFSKGWPLYLTEHARVLSTFGGHYDLAAFTMVMLVVFWSLFFTLGRLLGRIGMLLLIIGSFWLLILTASRTSFLAFLAGLGVVFFFWAFKRGIRWATTRYIVIAVLSVAVMLSFGDLSNRFTSILKLDRRIDGIISLALRPFGKPPTRKAVFLENNINAVTSPSDTPPTPVKPGGDGKKDRPDDVFDDLPDGFAATGSGDTATIAAIPRTYSETALQYDLSTGIRLDALWPRAIASFKKNPLLGTGYSTLNKTNVEDFTEAESTDNDYLRALGETGFLGFATFFGTIGMLLFLITRSFARVRQRWFAALLIGFAAGTVGLLVNAMYIDVFEASKIAFPYWAIAGIVLGGLKTYGPDFHQRGRLPRLSDLGIVNPRRRLAQIAGKVWHSNWFVLLILIAIALVVRFHRIDTPLADWHSWRQADTSAVTRNFVSRGISFLYPTFDDLSSIPSGLPNPRGLRMVEFPLYNAAATVVDKIAAGPSVDFSGRLTTILFSLGTLTFLYALVKQYWGKRAAIFAAFFFAVLPFNIFYSRVILPEPTMVFFATGMVYFFDRWIRIESWRYYLLAAVFGAAALLVKPTAAFLAFPLGYLVWRKWGFAALRQPALYLFVILVTGPFLWWRWWVSHFPEGVPAFLWLFNGDGIRFKGAFFWWLFGQRTAKLILGFWGLPLLLLGVLLRPKPREGWLFHWWLIGLIVYLFVFATGNVTHDYYQIILVPILVIFLARGADFLLSRDIRIFPFVSRVTVLVVSVGLMLALGWRQARDFFNINRPEIVEAGREFDRLVENDKATVVAPYNGDTAFLYQTSRAGWPIMEGSIDDMIARGAHFYVSVDFDDTTNEIIAEATDPKGSKKGFKLIKQTPDYVIVQLVPDKKLP